MNIRIGLIMNFKCPYFSLSLQSSAFNLQPLSGV
jgi:hypothetical protein